MSKKVLKQILKNDKINFKELRKQLLLKDDIAFLNNVLRKKLLILREWATLKMYLIKLLNHLTLKKKIFFAK